MRHQFNPKSAGINSHKKINMIKKEASIIYMMIQDRLKEITICNRTQIVSLRIRSTPVTSNKMSKISCSLSARKFYSLSIPTITRLMQASLALWFKR